MKRLIPGIITQFVYFVLLSRRNSSQALFQQDCYFLEEFMNLKSNTMNVNSAMWNIQYTDTSIGIEPGHNLSD